MADCFTNCIKFLFFVFTLLLFLVGIALIGVASYMAAHYGDVFDATDDYSLSYVSYGVITVGVLLLVLGFLGCCGTWKKNKWLLYMFSVILLLIIVGEIALVVLSFVYKSDVKNNVTTGLESTMDQYFADESTQESWDWVQDNIGCCGITHGAVDWSRVIIGYVPDSCCDDCGSVTPTTCKPTSGTNDVDATCVPVTNKGLYTEGCGSKLDDLIEDNLLIVAVILLIFCFLQFLGVVAACIIASSNKLEEYRVV